MEDNPSTPGENSQETSLQTPRNTKPLPQSQPGWRRLASPSVLAVLGVVSLALLAVAAVGWFWLQNQSTGVRLEAPSGSPIALEALATDYPELGTILQDPKLDSVYKDFLVAYQEGGEEAALELAQKRGLLNANGDLRLTLELDTSDTAPLQAELEANGIQVTAVSGSLMDVAIPMAMLEAMMAEGNAEELLSGITNLPHIQRIRLPKVGISDQTEGGVETESVPRIGAVDWQNAGITGKGVRVGVLDLGFDNYKQLLGVDLPANVTVRSFITGKEADQAGTPHGTAVAEIIHDIAPDAELFFAAYETDVEEREAVEWLISQGVRIISHSAGSIYGPMDGSTDEALWVDSIVDNGVLWVNSAGNTGYTHYRAAFTDSDGDGYHEFSPGDEMMGFFADGQAVLVVNWDDWKNGTEDLDLYIFDPNGEELASSTNVQDGPGDDAAEGIVYVFPDTRTYYVAFYGKNITRPVVMDFFLRSGEIEYFTPEHSVTTPGDSRRALTVGAVNWSDDVLEDYSSRGPTNDNRLKPELAAPAGISSAAFGETWVGTSASTPHVSGAAALILQAFPNYTPDQVAEFLKSRALDLGGGGPDNSFGFGRLSLGAPPDLSALVVATPTPLPSATPTQAPAVGAPTLTPTITSTPERRDLSTPEAGDDDGSGGLIMGLLACVVLPAMMGLGGIAIVAGVFYMARRRKPGPGAGYGYYTPPTDYGPGPQPYAPAPARPGGEIRCPRCGSEHRANARFCPVCGLALSPELYAEGDRLSPPDQQDRPPAREPAPPDRSSEEKKVFCNQCGQSLRPESKFCPHCGAPRSKV